MKDYESFLLSKQVKPPAVGFDTKAKLAKLFEFQRKIVRWSLKLGRAAIFADTGLGKTPMQLHWADAVAKQSRKPVLILTPLAVAGQTIREGEKFGIKVNLCRSSASVTKGINVTNYQKLLDRHGKGLSDQWDFAAFSGVVLDESSILKSFEGKTKNALIQAFQGTDYRLCCTATPSPNDHTELGNHAEFLSVMSSKEMLARWFVNDQSETGKWRLKKHSEKDFWRWVSTWSVCIGKPSDLGRECDDEGFVLPPLNLIQEIAAVDATQAAPPGMLWRDASLTATSLHKEKRLTCTARSEIVARLANASKEQWLIWCDTNYEADEIRALIPDCVEARGSDTDEKKEEKVAKFLSGEARVLLSKPSMFGYGLNLQRCHNIAFVGLSYSHEQFYQAVRRCWRFGQKEPVNCHVVIADTEGEVLATIKRKEEQLLTMRREMVEATRETILEDTTRRERAIVQIKIERSENDKWQVSNGDCVEVVKGIADNSIGLSVFSPPFSELFVYSDALADMGNSANDAEFFKHFGFLVPELYRVTCPGRLCAVHCKDMPKFKWRDGVHALRDFPGGIISLFEQHGWSYHSRVAIWKDPVTEMQRTKDHGLLYKELRKDSCGSRQAMPDYLLMFRKQVKDGEEARPVSHWSSEELKREQDAGRLTSEAAAEIEAFPLEQWQRWASPIWMDIDQQDTLNYRIAKGNKDEKHICPLQLEVIRRAVRMWSCRGDTVLSPFAGIGSEGFVSVIEGRKFIGAELKERYWEIACNNLRDAESQAKQVSLYDLMEKA